MGEGNDILKPLLKGLPQSLACGHRCIPVWDVKLGRGGGRADLVVVSDEPSVVIVEAKLHDNPALKDSVVGQVMLYYVTALTSEPHEILAGLRRAAERHKRNENRGFDELMREAAATEAEVLGWIAGAKELAMAGAPSVRAVIATDAWDESRDARRLGKIVSFLANRGIKLGVVVVADGIVTWPTVRHT
jgi:hypothetical protein